MEKIHSCTNFKLNYSVILRLIQIKQILITIIFKHNEFKLVALICSPNQFPLNQYPNSLVKLNKEFPTLSFQKGIRQVFDYTLWKILQEAFSLIL